MTYIITFLALCIIGKIISAAQEKARQAQIARIRIEQQRQREEQARMREDFRREQAEAREQAKRQAEIERETARLAKEQEKQAAQLAKHEKRMAELTFRMKQAEKDVAFLKDRIGSLDAQRDFLLLQQAGTVPGCKEHTKLQSKIISLDSQIHAAEAKLAKAKHTRSSARKELSSA